MKSRQAGVQHELTPIQILRRDGHLVAFDRGKIEFAVLQAGVAVGERNREVAVAVTDDVLAKLDHGIPTVEEVQDLVEKALIMYGHANIAKAYIIYRYEHALKRESRPSLAYSYNNIPYKKLWEALAWSTELRCAAVSDLQLIERPEDLIAVSDEFYREEVRVAVEKVDDAIDLVVVAGPSASGKTTTSMVIADQITETGRPVLRLEGDNYFFDIDKHPRDRRGDYDYETPQALDIERLILDLQKLLAGESVMLRCYDFKAGKSGEMMGPVNLEKGSVVVLDSLHGLNEQIAQAIDTDRCLGIYVETLAQQRDESGRFLRWTDLRLLRRMVRDARSRNHGVRDTLMHWHFVRRSELRYIISRLSAADAIVNSYLPYELPFLKRALGHRLAALDADIASDTDAEDARDRLKRVMAMISEVPDDWDEQILPADSLLREFVGGSSRSY